MHNAGLEGISFICVQEETPSRASQITVLGILLFDMSLIQTFNLQ